MSNIHDIVQNLLTNVTVGNDINIETINQVASQIVIQHKDISSSTQIYTSVTIQLLEILKANSGETKKTLLLQFLKTCQYSEDLPIDLREEASEIYAALESLEPEKFETLLTAKGKRSVIGRKLNWFLLGTCAGVSSNKLKKSVESLFWSINDSAYVSDIEDDNRELLIDEIQNQISSDNSLTLSKRELVENTLEIDRQADNTEAETSSAETGSPNSFKQNLNYSKEDRAALIGKILEERLKRIEIDQELPDFDQSLLSRYSADKEGLESPLDVDGLKKLINDYDLSRLTNSLLDTDISNLGIDLSEMDVDLSDIDADFDFN